MKRFVFQSALLLLQLRLGASEFKLFANMPIGEYRAHFKSFYSCDPTKVYKMQYNLNLTQISKNVTELRGNMTITVPFDDNLMVEINIAVKDPKRGWKENIMIQKIQGACSMLKNLLGQMWIPLLHGLGVRNEETCPIPAGFYTAPGLDTSIIEKGDNIPKAFIYGTFKFRLTYTLKKEIISCMIFIVDIKRP